MKKNFKILLGLFLAVVVGTGVAYAARRTLRENVLVVQAIPAQTIGVVTAINSDIIDTRGYGRTMFVANIGSITDNDASFTISIYDSDDSALSGSATVAAEYLIGTAALASWGSEDDNEVRSLEYIGLKRYVRLTITPSLFNGSGSASISVLALQSDAENAPVTQQ